MPNNDPVADGETIRQLAEIRSTLHHMATGFDQNASAMNGNFGFMGEMQSRIAINGGRVMARANRHLDMIDDFGDVEFHIYSQWGEDGIIDWLIGQIDMPNHRFIEFGVENFAEANCRFLLEHRNWRGLVFDGSQHHIDRLRQERLFWRQDLTAECAFITAENIDGLITRSGFSGELGILSIDIDGNDYWVWERIESVRPAIVSIEYNAILGDQAAVVVPYQEDFTRFRAHYSGLYFGASLPALRHLAAERNYEFLGTNTHGVNAFFVRGDLAPQILPKIRNRRGYPSRMRDSRDESGQLSFTGGAARFDLIRALPVIDVKTGSEIALGKIGQPYSAEWLKLME